MRSLIYLFDVFSSAAQSKQPEGAKQLQVKANDAQHPPTCPPVY